MTPQELGKVIGVDPKNIRKYARKVYGNTTGSWDFNLQQVADITKHFSGSVKAVAAAPAIAPPITELTWNSIDGLTLIARKFLKETYDMKLDIPIKINSRLSRALGRFRHLRSTIKAPVDIELSADCIKNHGKETTIDILKHELVHYALYMQDRDYRDGQADFESELKRLGISRTHTYQAKGQLHTYSCKDCGKTVGAKKRQLDLSKGYRSKCCRAGLNYEGLKDL